jgi:tetratricopeptide (TPR) repeat protein
MRILIACLLLSLSFSLYGQTPQVNNLSPLEDRFALIIGISRYLSPENKLDFADKDADALHQALINSCRFSPEHIQILKNEEATYDKIRRNIEGWLSKQTTQKDTILIYFSGHGSQDTDDGNDEEDGLDEFLLPYDYDDDDMSSAIRDDIFSIWINNLKSEKIVIIIDTCFSGGATRAKGINHIKTKGPLLVDGINKDIFKEIPKTGVALLAACSDRQSSNEEPDFRSGLFTHFLLESIKKENDTNNDNRLSLEELFEPTKRDVEAFSKKKYKDVQSPQFISTLTRPIDLSYLPLKIAKSPDNHENESDNIVEQAIMAHDETRKFELLEEAVRVSPTNPRARYHMASACLKARNFDKAIQNAEILIQLNSSVYNGDAYDILAQAYEQMNDLKLARQYILMRLEERTDDESLYNALARIYAKEGNFSEANENYQKSLRLNSRFHETYFGLARLYLKQEQYDQALRILDEDVSINPDQEDSYYLKGFIFLYARDDPKQAKPFYEHFSKKNILYSITLSTFRDELFQWEWWKNLNDSNDFIAEYYACQIIAIEKSKESAYSKKYSVKRCKEMLIENYPLFKNQQKYAILMSQVK